MRRTCFHSMFDEIFFNAHEMFNTLIVSSLRTSDQQGLEAVKAKAKVAILLQLSVSG